MSNLDFYKECYFKEIEYKEHLQSAFSTPLSLISAMVAAFYFFLISFDYHISIILSVLFILCLLSAGTMICICIFYLIYSYNNFLTGRTYRYMPETTELRKYQKELQKYYATHFNMDSAQADEKFEESLIEMFVDGATRNINQNEEKSVRLADANKYLIIGILLTLLTFIPFCVNHFLIKKYNSEKGNSKFETIISIN